MNIRHTDVIGRDFFENGKGGVERVELAVNGEYDVVDQSIRDVENDTYAIIPCIVVRIDESTRIPGRKYYMFQAHESRNDEQMNSQEEAGIKFYKYLENTSPYIIKVNEVIDATKKK